MPLISWFRSHQTSTNVEAAHSITATSSVKANTKWNKPTTQRSLRSRSLGSGLRVTRDTTAKEASQCTRCKSRRRFTVDGLSYRRKHGNNEWSCNAVPRGPPLLMNSTASTHFGHDSVRTQQTTFPPDAHPSIIFIDCPP